MIPLEFAVATAATAASIGGILTVYVVVLKRNGWIGHATRQQSPANPKEEAPQSTIEKPATAKIKKSRKPREIKKAVPEPVKEESGPAGAADVEKKIFLKQKLAKTLIEAQKSSENYEVPRRCAHHFGYLYSLEKDAEIPDECYSCSKLIQCTQLSKK